MSLHATQEAAKFLDQMLYIFWAFSITVKLFFSTTPDYTKSLCNMYLHTTVVVKDTQYKKYKLLLIFDTSHLDPALTFIVNNQI